tara:strand:- start:333 stop:1445 length:1113 start_codon:yes stop_codon:yes gene_type:complete
MSKSYTPGLKVLDNCKIQKDRILPLKGSVLKQPNDKVDSKDIVASTNIPGNVHMINVANKLNIDAEFISKCMRKKIGESVCEGEVIAESKGLFGMFKSDVKSPINGTLEQISDITGQIVLSEPPVPIEVDAYIPGIISDVMSEEGVVVSSIGTYIQGILGIGGEQQGELVVIPSNKRDFVLNNDFKNKILVFNSSIDYDMYKEAERVGVKGLIVGGFDYSSLSKILGYSLGVAITGSEKTLTLIITEGFGNVSMSDRTFNLLEKNNGSQISVNGTTQIRAGVMRPEIFIYKSESKKNSEQFNEDDLIISLDSNVRVIREPYFGKIGKVSSLPNNLEKMESETMVRTAEITFNDGTKKIVPRANLEVILSN